MLISAYHDLDQAVAIFLDVPQAVALKHVLDGAIKQKEREEASYYLYE